MTEWQKRKRERELGHQTQQLAQTFEAIGSVIEDLRSFLNTPLKDADDSEDETPHVTKSLKR